MRSRLRGRLFRGFLDGCRPGSWRGMLGLRFRSRRLDRVLRCYCLDGFHLLRLRLGGWLGHDFLGRRRLLGDSFGRRFLHRSLLDRLGLFRGLGDSNLGLTGLGFAALARNLSMCSFLDGGGTTRGFRHLPSPFWPWRPAVIAQYPSHRQPSFWNTCNIGRHRRFRRCECRESIDHLPAQPLQTLREPSVRTALSLLPQLLGLCTDCGVALRTMAGRTAGWMADTTLPAAVLGR